MLRARDNNRKNYTGPIIFELRAIEIGGAGGTRAPVVSF